MLRPDELGQLKAGFLADIVLVNGAPLTDLSMLTDPAKIQRKPHCIWKGLTFRYERSVKEVSVRLPNGAAETPQFSLLRPQY